MKLKGILAGILSKEGNSMKKLLPIISACSIFVLTEPMVSNSVYIETDTNFESYQSTISGFSKLDNCTFLKYCGNYIGVPVKFDRIYVKENQNSVIFLADTNLPQAIKLNLTDVSGEQAVRSLINAYNSENDTNYVLKPHSYGEYNWIIVSETDDDFSNSDVKKLSDLLSQSRLIDKITFQCSRISQKIITSQYLMTYDATEQEIIEDFISSSKIDCRIEEDDSGNCIQPSIKLIPNYKADLSEQVKIVQKLSDETDITPIFNIPESSPVQYSFEIDALNATDGDSNCDGDVNIADAVLVQQFIVNPDRYNLSEQGKYNADVYNTGDGVTMADALEIQLMIANS